MRSRRGAVSGSAALAAAALAVGASVSSLVVLGACGAFDATSDDVSDGASDGAPPSADASTDTQQPTTDAPHVDAPASPDAGEIGDGACGHDFCADFESADAQAGWTMAHRLSGTLSVVPDGGVSGNALSSSIIGADMPQQYAYLAQDFSGASGVHLELDVNVPSASFDPATSITLMQFSGGATESGVGIQLASNPPTVQIFVASGMGVDTNVAPIMTAIDLPRDQWVHCVVDMHYGAGKVLSLDVGALHETYTIDTVDPPMSQLRVGVQHYNGPTPALNVLYDTVRADLY